MIQKTNCPNRSMIAVMLLCILSMSACNKEFNINSWEPDMLLPLVKGKVRVQDVTDLRNKKVTQQIPAIDIGYPEYIPVNVPPINISFVGPYPYELSEGINFVEVDSLDLGINFTNFFPLTISQGTRIVFRSSPDTGTTANIILSHVITNDILPNQQYSVNILVTDKLLNSNIYLYLENFTSAGGNNLVFTGQNSEIDYSLRFLSLYKTGIKTNQIQTVTDSTTIEIEEDTQSYNDSTATGQLTVFLDNTIPISFEFQLYLYDETHTVLLDSLYHGNMFVAHGTTDIDGNSLTAGESKFEIALSAERLSRIKQAKFAVYRLTGDTYGSPGTNVTAGSQCSLIIQITGDLKIKVAKLFDLNF